jgi:hypothetical protein
MMMNEYLRYNVISKAPVIRLISFVMAICVLLTTAGCGGHHNAGALSQYPSGTLAGDDLDRHLKFDSRVTNFEPEGDNKLIVNVTQEWVSSPPGMQERSLARWFEMLQAARGNKNVEVIVRYEGNEVARWTNKNGLERAAKDKSA